MSINQNSVCEKFGASFLTTNESDVIGIADGLNQNSRVINGLRHPPQGSSCGWYIWADQEFSDDESFFKPLHLLHVQNLNRKIIPYLGLGVGWRFLLAPNYEDVWFDAKLTDLD